MNKRGGIHAWLPKVASTVIERGSGIDIWPLSLKKGATVFAVYLKILRLINRVNSVLYITTRRNGSETRLEGLCFSNKSPFCVDNF